MGLYRDALKFFEAAPTPIDTESTVACATCNFYMGSLASSIRLLLSVEESIE